MLHFISLADPDSFLKYNNNDSCYLSYYNRGWTEHLASQIKSKPLQSQSMVLHFRQI